MVILRSQSRGQRLIRGMTPSSVTLGLCATQAGTVSRSRLGHAWAISLSQGSSSATGIIVTLVRAVNEKSGRKILIVRRDALGIPGGWAKDNLRYCNEVRQGWW